MARAHPPAVLRWHSDAPIAAAVCLALVVAVGVLYAQTARFEFLSMDDYNVLARRPIVYRGLSAEGVAWALRAVEPNWHPVTWLSHMLDFTLFGADAGAHHLVNAGLHAANAVLLFLALRALSGALWPSALAAALFALHPMRAESVAWVTERKDVLSGLFWMLTLLAYAWYVRRPAAGRYALVCVALALGLAAKTMLITLPFILLLLDVWPLERWRLPSAAGGPPARGRWSLGQLVVEKLPLLLLVVAGSAVTLFMLRSIGGLRTTEQFSIAWRLANTPIAYVTYLVQTVWPARLAAMYPHPALIAGTDVADVVWPAIGAATALAAVSAFCVAFAPRRPYLAVGWLWYLVALAPVIGIVQVGLQSHADRFSYLPMIGVYIMVAWGLRDAVARRPRLRVPVVAATALVLAALAAASWRQIGTWQTSRRVFEQALAVTENNYYAHQALAAILSSDGEFDAARRHLDEALRIRPSEAYAHEQLGLLFERQGERDRAAAEYEIAVQLSPRSYHSRVNLGAIRLGQRRFAEAADLLAAALQMTPDHSQVLANLGTALLQQQRYAEATVHLERAVTLSPNSAQAHNNLGVALAQQGRYADAATHFERALALNPNHPNAGRSLEYVRAQLAQP